MIRDFDWSEFAFLLAAARWTIALSALAFAGGAVGGLVIALCRTSPYWFLRFVARAFIELFQGTPLLLQLFVFYFGLGLIISGAGAWTAAAIAFTAHASAFLGEIWRGSIEAVPRGQTEAAHALSLSYATRLRHIVLPQAFRISLPSTVGFLVQLIKGTSLAAIIGFTELTRSGQIVSNTTFQPFLVYSSVAAIYFAICWPLSLYSARLEGCFAVARR